MSGHTKPLKSQQLLALDTYFSLSHTLRFLVSTSFFGALQSCYLWRFIGCLRYILLMGYGRYWATSHSPEWSHFATVPPGDCTSDLKVLYQQLVVWKIEHVQLNFYLSASVSRRYNSITPSDYLPLIE